MARIANSVIDLIGQTPIVKLNKLQNENSADIYLKLEYFNPGSSVKDRIALAMIEAAEKMVPLSHMIRSLNLQAGILE